MQSPAERFKKPLWQDPWRSVVIAFSLVPDGANMDAIGCFDFKKNDITRRPKRDDQFSGEWTITGFAAAEWAHRQKLTGLSYRLDRFDGVVKIACWAV